MSHSEKINLYWNFFQVLMIIDHLFDFILNFIKIYLI
jgi:hypothetical protein